MPSRYIKLNKFLNGTTLISLKYKLSSAVPPRHQLLHHSLPLLRHLEIKQIPYLIFLLKPVVDLFLP